MFLCRINSSFWGTKFPIFVLPPLGVRQISVFCHFPFCFSKRKRQNRLAGDVVQLVISLHTFFLPQKKYAKNPPRTPNTNSFFTPAYASMLMNLHFTPFVDAYRTAIHFLRYYTLFMEMRVGFDGKRWRVACVERFCRLDFLFLFIKKKEKERLNGNLSYTQ